MFVCVYVSIDKTLALFPPFLALRLVKPIALGLDQTLFFYI